ncbi:cytochrome P450 [Penicillium hordei]|uniref:Cytochrome P450 n=1 Tax=Penicillium hordei TaxID=40994 RepID=A0AAD6DZP5_9EURO|nr:cytochrome P450 [Penicillium hordei]KAJ5597960.1 cytochrome P450 [Penicillium hordei]
MALYRSFFSKRQRPDPLNQGCQPLRMYPHKDRIFGLDFVYQNVTTFRRHKYLETLKNRYQTLGTTYGVRVFNRRGILTSDPENIKTILSTRFKDYSLGNRVPIMGPLLGRGIFVSDGQDWSHSRALLRPNFVKEQVADLRMIETHLAQLLKLIPSDGRTVIELQDLFLRFTLDSATDFLFGHSLHTLSRGTAKDQQFGQAFALALDDIALQFRLGPWRALRRPNREALAAYEICRGYVEGFVSDAIAYRQGKANSSDKNSSDRSYFLKELAQATDDRDRIRDELLNILIAGRDTTASLLGSLFYVLARHPDVWQKLRSEVAAQLQGAAPNYEQLRNLQYTRYCINETLRLYPPVPNNTKMAVCDTILPRGGGPKGDGPVFVPKGCTMIYTVYAMHRRTDLFGPDAEEYRPERWATQRFSWEFLPFNGGPRICLGQQYALTEAMYVLVRFAQTFQTIEARDSAPWTEQLTLTLSSSNGVKVRLKGA